MSLAKSGSLASLCVMYGAAIAFMTTLVVSNGAGAAAAGEFFNLMAFFALATSLTVFGADTGLVRTFSAQRAVGRVQQLPRLLHYASLPVQVFSCALSAGVIVYALLADLPTATRNALLLAAPCIPLAAVMTLCFGALRGLSRVVLFTLLQNVLLPTLRLVAVFAVVAWGASQLQTSLLPALTLAWTLPVLAVCAIAGILTHRVMGAALADPVEPKPAGASGSYAPAENFRSFWSFSSARGFAALVETALEWVDVLCVSAFAGPVAAGIYGAVNRCVRVGTMIEHTCRIVTGPAISAALAIDNRKRASDIFLATTRVLTLLAWPFYLSLAFFGPTLLSVFGRDFSAGAPILWVIAPAVMLSMSAGGVQSLLLMSGKSRWQLGNKLAALVLSLVLNFSLVPSFGMWGAVIAWALAILIDTALASYQVFKLVGIRASWAQMAPTLLLAAGIPSVLAAACLTWHGQGLKSLVIYAVTFCGSYAALCWVAREYIGLSDFLASRRGSKASVGIKD